jgi:hypothetical protein
VWCFCSKGWPQTLIFLKGLDLPIYNSCIAGIRDVHNQFQLVLWDWVLLTFLPKLALNCNPPIFIPGSQSNLTAPLSYLCYSAYQQHLFVPLIENLDCASLCVKCITYVTSSSLWKLHSKFVIIIAFIYSFIYWWFWGLNSQPHTC